MRPLSPAVAMAVMAALLVPSHAHSTGGLRRFLMGGENYPKISSMLTNVIGGCFSSILSSLGMSKQLTEPFTSGYNEVPEAEQAFSANYVQDAEEAFAENYEVQYAVPEFPPQYEKETEFLYDPQHEKESDKKEAEFLRQREGLAVEQSQEAKEVIDDQYREAMQEPAVEQFQEVEQVIDDQHRETVAENHPGNVVYVRDGRDGKIREQVIDTTHRETMTYDISFEECRGKTVAECETLIKQIHETNPSVFHGGAEPLEFLVHEIPQRAAMEKTYNLIALMTNMAGTGVVGTHGDGIVRYRNPLFDNLSLWCTSEEPCLDNPNRDHSVPDKCCFSVGPWDCDTGVPKTFEECCSMIQSSVPGLDFHGNTMQCHPRRPFGSAANPKDNRRIFMRVDADGVIVGEPVNM